MDKFYNPEFIDVVIECEDLCGRIHGTGNTPHDFEKRQRRNIIKSFGRVN